MTFPLRQRRAEVQLVTNCNQLKNLRLPVSVIREFRTTVRNFRTVQIICQSVTKCDQLKAGGRRALQPVTICYQLKISAGPRNLIPPL
jgi:hypothetical protein